MVEFENLRFRLLESEKPIENLREALAIDHITGEIKRHKPLLLIFGTIWITAKGF